MRVSTDKDDAGFWQFNLLMAAEKQIDVFLDGIHQKHCMTADDECGIVVRCVVDSEGGIQISPDNPNEIWYETVAGKVEIRLS